MVPSTDFPPVSPQTHRHETEACWDRQGCYMPREGAKGSRFQMGSMGVAATLETVAASPSVGTWSFNLRHSGPACEAPKAHIGCKGSHKLLLGLQKA